MGDSVLLDPYLTHFAAGMNFDTGFWEAIAIYRGQRFEVRNAKGSGRVMKWLDQCIRAALKA